MALSDFLNVNLAVQCEDLAGEINKVYQRTGLAGKNEAVDRLRRQSNRLAQLVGQAQSSRNAAQTKKLLEESALLIHECVPLMDLCLRKLLLSQELHQRWVKKLKGFGEQVEDWGKAL